MASGEIPYDCVATQTKNALTNLESIAQAAGTSLQKAVKVTVYLTDMADFATMNEVYGGFFPENPGQGVRRGERAAQGVTVEIDAICLCEN